MLSQPMLTMPLLCSFFRHQVWSGPIPCSPVVNLHLAQYHALRVTSCEFNTNVRETFYSDTNKIWIFREIYFPSTKNTRVPPKGRPERDVDTRKSLLPISWALVRM